MKTSDSIPPRLACRVLRGGRALLGDGFGARHVAACEGCRQFFDAGDELEFQLQRAAKRQRPPVPAGLERRIAEAVHRSARAEPTRRRRSMAAGISFAAAAACVALVVFVSQKSPAPKPGAEIVSVGATPAAGIASDSMFDRWWSGLQPSAGAVLDGQPLQTEAAAVYSDARSALGFLALNFMPSVVLASAQAEAPAPPRLPTKT